jgi:cell division protein FtsQ
MPRKRANRRIQRKPRKKFEFNLKLPEINWGRIANVFALVLVLVGSYNGTLWLMDRPIEMVRIEGAFARVSSPQVEAAMRGYLDQGFLAVDIKKLQAEIADMPWVRSATVRRLWPNSLQVQVTEEQVAARWGKSGLVNRAGDLFVEDATHIPAELPRLDGPDGSNHEVTALFFDLRARLEQVGLVAVALQQDARGAWELQTSNGMRVRFGAMHIEQRIDRFFVALEQVLTPIADQIDYVDMRYTNGFAIGWKTQGDSDTRLADLTENDPHA